MREIQLTQNKVTLVDNDDFEELNKYKWYFGPNGCAARAIKGKTVLMHRVIMNPPSNLLVDHIDGNPLNNCKNNLRITNKYGNKRNCKSHINSASKYKGVTIFPKRKTRFAASIRIDNKLIWLGRFKIEEEAAKSYDEKAREYFGEFGRYNFPLPGEQSALR